MLELGADGDLVRCEITNRWVPVSVDWTERPNEAVPVNSMVLTVCRNATGGFEHVTHIERDGRVEHMRVDPPPSIECVNRDHFVMRNMALAMQALRRAGREPWTHAWARRAFWKNAVKPRETEFPLSAAQWEAHIKRLESMSQAEREAYVKELRAGPGRVSSDE